jgi:Flp pilus assembly protein protease CpaA
MPATLWTHERMISTTTAVFAGSLLFSTGAFGSWAGAGAVGLLMAGVEEDVRAHRLPNRLTGFGLGAALLYAAWTAGIGGLLAALAGAAAGLAVGFLPFALRWLGAGDVKAAMALGAFLGAGPLASVLTWSTLFAGAVALSILATQGGLGDLLRRWLASLVQSLATRRPCYFGPTRGSAAASGLPFGVALALGVAAHVMWGTPWTL